MSVKDRTKPNHTLAGLVVVREEMLPKGLDHLGILAMKLGSWVIGFDARRQGDNYDMLLNCRSEWLLAMNATPRPPGAGRDTLYIHFGTVLEIRVNRRHS